MSRILPEEFHDDIPSGFNSVGHVAHLNLRSRFDPYKRVIAEVIVDKNPLIRTVINKVDNVGTESAYRTFQYEVLAGEDDMDVQVMESGCVFSFNYAKVYWNSRLETEHSRLVRLFQPGEVVCDVMAGIGPFAVPAGKKGVFVWANDMNPESYKYLLTAIEKNKASRTVIAYHFLLLTKLRSPNLSAPSTRTADSSSAAQPTSSSPHPKILRARRYHQNGPLEATRPFPSPRNLPSCPYLPQSLTS